MGGAGSRFAQRRPWLRGAAAPMKRLCAALLGCGALLAAGEPPRLFRQPRLFAPPPRPAAARPAVQARSVLAFQTSGLWILSRIFGEGPNFQISDGQSESSPNFASLVVGCFDADFRK